MKEMLEDVEQFMMFLAMVKPSRSRPDSLTSKKQRRWALMFLASGQTILELGEDIMRKREAVIYPCHLFLRSLPCTLEFWADFRILGES